MPREKKIDVEEYRRRLKAGELDDPPVFQAPSPRTAPRKNKFNAEEATIDGHNFASKEEAKRYLVLLDAQRRGVIQNLALQPRFTVQESFKYDGRTIRKIEAVMDFAYDITVDQWQEIRWKQTIVEDLKGRDNPLSRLKRKLFLAQYGDQYHFRIVKSATDPVGLSSVSSVKSLACSGVPVTEGVVKS